MLVSFTQLVFALPDGSIAEDLWVSRTDRVRKGFSMADTTGRGNAVIGYFATQAKAERAIDAQIGEGFTSQEIGVAMRGEGGSAGTSTAETSTGSTYANKATDVASNAGEHAESAWGKVKSFFGGGDPVEPYADERTEGDFASREITAGGSSDYEHDDVHGSLEGITGSGDHAKYFGSRLQQGAEGVVITVTANDRAKTETAERILEQNGADLGRDRESFAETAAALPATGEQNIKLYGEVLRVHKDRVSRGEVRLRKETHTDMQTIQVPVTREELVIERVPVTGQTATTGAADAFSDQEIRIPLSEERASVEKQAILREEVRVGKREVSETESFNESVRSEELKVEDETTASATATGDTFKR